MAQHELLLAVPRGEDGAQFPVERIEEYLNGQRFRLFDQASGLFFLCGSPAGTQFARVRILTEPDEPLPSVVMIRVAPQEIQIWQRADQDALVQAREFAEWLLANFPSSIKTPSGEDISGELHREYAG